MSTIDLRSRQQQEGQDPADNIIKIINAAAQAKQSKLTLEKELMLDDIRRSRDIRDKSTIEQNSKQNELAGFERMFGGGQPQQPANAWQAQQPQYSEQNPPPMSMPDGTTSGTMPQQGQPQGLNVPPQYGGGQAQPQSQPQRKTDVVYKGIRLPSAMEVVQLMKAGGQQVNGAKMKIYHDTWTKASQGLASEGELKMMADFLDVDPDGKEEKFSPYLQMRKEKRIEELLTAIETNKPKKLMISEAEDAAKRISSGIYGKVKRGWTKNLSPDSPALGDYQKIKMVLLDAQLANVAFTKGAISDSEMKLFGEASANDELMSNPRMQVVFDKLNRFIKAQEKSKITSFKKIYGDDPMEWEELKDMGGDGQEGYSFNSEEEAKAANLPSGTEITINGRPAVWE